jgi:tetratricopeptide (TPR) repeat protein
VAWERLLARQAKKAAAARNEVQSRWRGMLGSLSLPGIEAWTTSMRGLFLNGMFLLTIIVVLPVFISQFSRDYVVIEPIATPDALQARGLTPEVAANRLWDGLHDVKKAARTAKESVASLPQAREVEFSFPDSGFSIESLVFHTRRLFNVYETRVAGEFVCGDPDCSPGDVSLRLRVVRQTVELIDLPPMGDTSQREYFAQAASGVLSTLDPFVAIAAASDKEPLRATILARRLIRGRHEDAKWAHNLIGNLRSGSEDWPAAIDEYRAALVLDPAFGLARTNLASVLVKAGSLDEARRELAIVEAYTGPDVSTEEVHADLAIANGDIDAAIRHLLRAAELDPLSPRLPTRAGRLADEAGRRAEANAYFRRALDIDPGYTAAYAALALSHMVDGDNAAAEKIYRDAADYAPDDAAIQAEHARLLMILDDAQGAAARLERAIALVPADVEYRYQYGQALHMLGLYGDAIETLTEAIALDPMRADLHMALADNYRDTGRNAEAVAEYRAFLDLDKEDSMMRPIAERFIELLSG